MTVSELFMVLGLEVDDTAFAAGRAAVGILQKGVAGLAAAFVASGVAAAAATVSAAKYAADMDDLSHRTGLSTTSLQELSHVAQLGGTSLEGLVAGVRHLALSMFEAKGGSAEAQAALAAVGVRATDAHGQLRPVDDVLGEVANRFSTMPDGAQKTALAMRVFGKSGTELIPVLNDGAQGMAALRTQAHGLGLVLDESTIAAGAKLDDQLDVLRASARGLSLAVGSQLIGPLTEVVAVLIELTKEATALARTKTKALIEGVAKAMRGAAAAGKFLVAQADLLKFALETLAVRLAFLALAQAQWAASSLLYLARIAAAMSFAGASALVAGAKAAAGAALAAAPAVLAAALWLALAAVIALAADDMWAFFTGGDSAIDRYGQTFVEWLGYLSHEWTAWLDGLTADDGDDWWITTQLKAAYRVLLDITGAWEKFWGAASQGDLLGALSTDLGKTLLPGASLVRHIVEGADPGSRFSPAALAPSPAGGARTDARTYAPTVHVTVPPGTDADGVGRATQAALEDHYRRELDAAGAVWGSP